MVGLADEPHVEVKLEGSAVPPGAVDIDQLAPLAAGLQRALRAVFRLRRGVQPVRAGEPGKEVRVGTGVRLVGLKAGSTILLFESAEVDLFGGRADEAVQDLVDQISSPGPIDATVVDALEDARRSLGEGGRIEFVTPWRPAVAFDSSSASRLRGEPTVLPVESVEVSGWLHAADLDPDEIRIRDAAGTDWVCQYPPKMEAFIQAHLGSVVRAAGSGNVSGKRGKLQLSRLEMIESPIGVSGSDGLEPGDLLRRLMEQQEVAGPQSLAVLRAEVDDQSEEELAFSRAIEELS